MVNVRIVVVIFFVIKSEIISLFIARIVDDLDVFWYNKYIRNFEEGKIMIYYTGDMHGVDGRLERGGSHDSGKFNWWVHILLGG